MRAQLAAFVTVILFAAPLHGAGVGTPKLSSPLDTPTLSEPMTTANFFDTTRFLTNAGLTYSASSVLSLQPELGLDYRGTGEELHGGVEQSTHRLHAQAGGRLSLAESFYLSAAAKLPMVTVEQKGLAAGEELGVRPDVGSRTGYDFIHPARNSVRWTGEIGIRLLPRADLMLYYDQNPLDGSALMRQHQEERIGTRFIIRFE